MIQGNYSFSRDVKGSTAWPFAKKKKKKTDETCLMIEIHLRAYAMKKNVIAELFLEIINNGPFFNTAAKM